MSINNETVGMSAEKAIGDAFNIDVSKIAARTHAGIVDSLKEPVKRVFEEKGLSKPVKYVGEKQSDTDFIQSNGQTLSVKTNQQKTGRTAPQKVGQPTSKTFAPNMLAEAEKSPDSSENFKALLRAAPADRKGQEENFKKIVTEYPHEVVPIYLKNQLGCDNLIHITNVVDSDKNPTNNPDIAVYQKSDPPTFKKDDFEFTQTAGEWTESNTMKYKGRAVMNLQVHKNRNCCKARFNSGGISILLHSDSDENA